MSEHLGPANNPSVNLASWDWVLEHAASIPLPLDEANQTLIALGRLRSSLGEAFLRRSLVSGHPLLAMFGNLAPWTRSWLAWFSAALDEAKQYGNYGVLVRRLRKPDQFSEGLSVLHVAHRLTRNGFRCIVEPMVTVGGRERRPDLLLIEPDTGEQIYVEVTRLMSSDEAREADACLRVIDRALRWGAAGIIYCGRIQTILVGDGLDAARDAVKATIRKAHTVGGLHEVPHPGLELAVCRIEDEALLAAWAEEHSVERRSLTGPQYEFNDLGRILPKAGRKQRQLSPEHPSRLAIWTASVFLSASQVESVVHYLEQQKNLLGHVYGVLILGEWLGVGDDEVRALGDHVYVAEVKHKIMQERILLVMNHHRSVPMSSEAGMRLREAIIGRSQPAREPS